MFTIPRQPGFDPESETAAAITDRRTKTLKARIAEAGIRSTAAWSQAAEERKPDMGFNADSTAWNVTLSRGRRRMSVNFYMGSALRGEPQTDDVLDCLLSDASLIENASSFEDFASELGYETDSRKAERTYKATLIQTERLKRFLGDDYSAFLWDTERL